MKHVIIAVCLGTLIAGCSKPNPEEYIARATAARDSSNFTAAIGEYEKLIRDYPDVPEAEDAMFAIASIRNDAMHDFPAAVKAYSKYLKEYPEGKNAALAMFLTAYIYNNELHDLTAAKAAYEKFISTYPDHEMAASAKFELENLGKTPEDLLPALQQQNEPKVAAKTKKK